MKKNLNRFLSCILILASCPLQAQQDKSTIDSLLNVIKTDKKDTTNVFTLNEISIQYINIGSYEQAMLYAQQAQQQAENLNYQRGLANAHNSMGLIYFYKRNYEMALDNYLISLKICEEIGNKKGIAKSFSNIGGIYMSQGNYMDALDNFFKSLKILEELENKQGIASSYNNIGNIYWYQGNYEKALNNHLKALKIREEIGDKNGIAYSYSSIGSNYSSHGDYEKALDNYLKALKIQEELGNKSGIAGSYGNIGVVYEKQGKYEMALKNHLKCLQIFEEIGDKQGIAISYDNVGSIYKQLGKFGASYVYLNQALIMDKEIGDKNSIKENYASLSDLYDKKGDYKQAYIYHKLYSDIKDTLLNEQSSKQIAEMNTKYDSEKKDKELIKKDAEISKQQAETEKQNLQRNAFIIGFALVLVLAFFIYKGYRQKQNANKLLEEKNSLIKKQKLIVEEKNIKITDSITYAKRIQQAILPSEELIISCLPESFIFFRPKDIVSGDFYWMHAIDKDQILLAVADCTGHGVPGALMSMMGYNLLEQIVKEHYIHEPAMILNELSTLIVESLRQTEELDAVKDGMDMSVCKINYQNYELEYAGAHNSLYLIQNGILTEIKADRRSVGIAAKVSSFTNHKIKLEKGDCLYMFSDGYADQKGGSENKKFFYQPFRDLLTEIHLQSMEEQRGKLEKVISEWKGRKEQIDDMLVIGVRI